MPRQSNANMFSLKCLNLRTDDGGQGPVPEETNLTISLQPIRINIDQVRVGSFFYFLRSFDLMPLHGLTGYPTFSRRLLFLGVPGTLFKSDHIFHGWAIKSGRKLWLGNKIHEVGYEELVLNSPNNIQPICSFFKVKWGYRNWSPWGWHRSWWANWFLWWERQNWDGGIRSSRLVHNPCIFTFQIICVNALIEILTIQILSCEATRSARNFLISGHSFSPRMSQSESTILLNILICRRYDVNFN